ncbi:hypothetical protein [Amycolatopsis viridis]|uniref:Uncharacterized protein n=1 Tax=Amycolatopsis viridis TaxID=185678 RepID=A0ABX0SR65_9PSEU|nr:hypothetical protein [Amycolatopsis viridis]NIH79125.1 hypothetical protein [Amycolatopsis viridis]
MSTVSTVSTVYQGQPPPGAAERPHSTENADAYAFSGQTIHA